MASGGGIFDVCRRQLVELLLALHRLEDDCYCLQETAERDENWVQKFVPHQLQRKDQHYHSHQIDEELHLVESDLSPQ